MSAPGAAGDRWPVTPRSGPVLVLGRVSEDVVVRPVQAVYPGTVTQGAVSRHRGGAMANTAVALARLGTDVVLLAHVGADAAGDRCLAALDLPGLHLQAHRAGRTSRVLCLIGVDGVPSFAADPGDSYDLRVEDLDSLWPHGMWGTGRPRPGVLIVSGRLLAAEHSRQAVLRAAQLARAYDMRVAVGLPSVGVIERRGVPEVLATLKSLCADLIVGTRAEVSALRLGTASAARALGAMAVVVTQSASPAVALLCDGRTRLSAATPTATPQDTTGAGDSFLAGLVHGWVTGEGVAASLSLGHQAAAVALSVAGGDVSVAAGPAATGPAAAPPGVQHPAPAESGDSAELDERAPFDPAPGEVAASAAELVDELERFLRTVSGSQIQFPADDEEDTPR